MVPDRGLHSVAHPSIYPVLCPIKGPGGLPSHLQLLCCLWRVRRHHVPKSRPLPFSRHWGIVLTVLSRRLCDFNFLTEIKYRIYNPPSFPLSLPSGVWGRFSLHGSAEETNGFQLKFICSHVLSSQEQLLMCVPPLQLVCIFKRYGRQNDVSGVLLGSTPGISIYISSCGETWWCCIQWTINYMEYEWRAIKTILFILYIMMEYI